jgi:hypothetical protein
MSAEAEELLRQQYLVPRASVKKLKEMSRKEGVSMGEIARRAIEAYTSGNVLSETDEETAARSLLHEVHAQVRASLKSIDAMLDEVRARERALKDGSLRNQVRRETQDWLRSHPREAGAVAELFAPGDSKVPQGACCLKSSSTERTLCFSVSASMRSLQSASSYRCDSRTTSAA